jgi:hypothetical protein
MAGDAGSAARSDLQGRGKDHCWRKGMVRRRRSRRRRVFKIIVGEKAW